MSLASAVAAAAIPLPDPDGADDDRALEASLDPLLAQIADARFVLLGESTHGTHEFYRVRAALTRRLVREKQFAALAIEGDWPAVHRVDRHVRGLGHDASASAALAGFERFPRWTWRNTELVELVRWARSERLRCYGLDMYSLHASIAGVVDYLAGVDPEAADRARARYACFDTFADPQRYGRATALGLREDCAPAVIAQLRELQHARLAALATDDGDPDETFAAEQNARVVAGAEAYYRAMYAGGVSTWNLRDTHMMDTLDAIAAHLDHADAPAKIVVWAHNSHCGDARATQRDMPGEHTLGQLCRERHPGETVLVGFTTDHGTVTAARDWDGPAETREVRPALPGSYEAVFHATGVPRFLLPLATLDPDGEVRAGLRAPLLERAIGVVYRPETERASHYFAAELPAQFDAVIHLDETRALEPL